MKVLWTDLAIERVGDIADYITRDNPAAAERWVKNIFEQVEEIKEYTNRYRHIPESSDRTLREVIFGNYRIIFKSKPDVITIMTVRHFKQILPIDDLT